MRPSLLTSAVLATFVSVSTFAQAQETSPTTTKEIDEPTPQTAQQELKKDMSHGLGFRKGVSFASYGFSAEDFDPAKYEQAMKMIDLIIQKRELQIAKKKQNAEKLFIANNATRKEVQTTTTGLQYEILKKGTGETYTPPTGLMNGLDRVTEFHIECSGKTLNGKEFINTPKDTPVTFNLKVIKGFSEALKMMLIGSKWKVYIPVKITFGLQRKGTKIEPNSMLIYEVEMHDITVRKTSPAQGGQPPHHSVTPTRP